DEDRGVTSVVIAVPSKATKEQEAKAEVAQQREEPDESHRDRRDEDVVVANVTELVRENAFELGAVHHLQQARCGRDGRMLRVAPKLKSRSKATTAPVIRTAKPTIRYTVRRLLAPICDIRSLRSAM